MVWITYIYLKNLKAVSKAIKICEQISGQDDFNFFLVGKDLSIVSIDEKLAHRRGILFIKKLKRFNLDYNVIKGASKEFYCKNCSCGFESSEWFCSSIEGTEFIAICPRCSDVCVLN